MFTLLPKFSKIIYRNDSGKMTMLKDKNNKSLLLFCMLILYIILYRIFVFSSILKYAESITCVFTILLFVLSVVLLGFRKSIKSPLKSKLFRNILVYLITYFFIIYGLGLSVGYLENSYSLKLISIIDNTFFLLITIVMTELFRYNYISSDKNNIKNIIILTILLSIFEINLFIRKETFTSFELIFKFITLSILPIGLKNAMSSYLVYKADYKSTILYRLIMDLYIYIVPIQPNLNDLFTSITMLLLPFGIIISSSRIVYNYENSTEHVFSKKYIKISDIPFAVVLIVLACTIFGIGRYKMLGIETGSMTPALNVGDAVVIDKKCDKDNLKEGDIIAFLNKDGKLIIHRIMKVNYDHTFITKGDFNNVADSSYVDKEQIQGKVNLKIPFIAYPALMLK